MWWAVWCVALVAGGACTLAAPASNALAPLSSGDWTQVDPSGPDDDAYGYAMPPVGGRYASAPWLYLLTDLPHDSQGGDGERVKRRMPSLSIDLPMSVLRQKLSLEKERKVQALRAAANRNYLNDIGKRAQSLEQKMRNLIMTGSTASGTDIVRLSEARARPKRKMPSLSINNPMEVLRQRLLLEVARKQMREANQRQAVANRLFLQNVGKRGFWTHPAPARYDN